MSSKELIVPRSSGQHLVGTQSMKDFLQHARDQPGGKMRAANEEKYPRNVTFGLPSEQPQGDDDQGEAQRELGKCDPQNKLENGRPEREELRVFASKLVHKLRNGAIEEENAN